MRTITTTHTSALGTRFALTVNVVDETAKVVMTMIRRCAVTGHSYEWLKCFDNLEAAHDYIAEREAYAEAYLEA